jgi:23S rRNA pseudouridine1911/1915/1917 synthase
MRLDKFLSERLPEISRARLQRLIRRGFARVDGVPVDSMVRLKKGQRIDLDIPPPEPMEIVGEAIALDILYEDRHLVVVAKPAGMVVHPGCGNREGTLVHALVGYFEELSRAGGPLRPGIVHRLDKETSGVMVVARSDTVHRELAAQFKAREVEKEYIALVEGILERRAGSVEIPLGRSRRDRKKMAVRYAGGRAAETRYRVLEAFGPASLVELRPRTGRTHQIRVHMASLGHPVLCDKTYSRRHKLYLSDLRPGAKRTRGEAPLLRRHALHARRLAFTHPVDGRRMAFSTPLPEDMDRVLAALREL